MMKNNKLALIFAMLFGLVATETLAEEGHGEEKAARPVEELAKTCASCHGEKGISTAPMYPHLAGQHASYLLHALKEYKAGRRQNQIMQPMVEGLSEEEMEALAKHFADMPGLSTPPREPAAN